MPTIVTIYAQILQTDMCQRHITVLKHKVMHFLDMLEI